MKKIHDKDKGRQDMRNETREKEKTRQTNARQTQQEKHYTRLEYDERPSDTLEAVYTPTYSTFTQHALHAFTTNDGKQSFFFSRFQLNCDNRDQSFFFFRFQLNCGNRDQSFFFFRFQQNCDNRDKLLT